MTTTIPDFRTFVAIDWSGAKGRRHKSIAVAVATPGRSAPRLVPSPAPGGWARHEVADFLLGIKGSCLAGFDFSFAPPWLDRQAYLPGTPTPETAPAFWAWVDGQCTDEDQGAARFLEVTQRRHFYLGKKDGRKADFMRLRVCEEVFNEGGGGKPSSIFDAIGAAQVAKASFAGMRVLHHLRTESRSSANGAYAVWPFDPRGPRTVVEIYTRAFLRLSGGRGTKIRDHETLTNALHHLDSEATTDAPVSDHETDALVAAAGLRLLARDPASWAPRRLSPAVAMREGWTFGVGTGLAARRDIPQKACQ